MTSLQTSGSTLTQEIIKYVEVNQERIDRIRHATATIKVIDGVILGWTWAIDERRGREIDFL